MTGVYTVVLVAILALLIYRTKDDIKQYAKFKKFKDTNKRQEMYRKWAIESFLLFGGLSLLLWLLAGKFIPTILDEAANYQRIAGIKEVFTQGGDAIAGFLTALLVGALLPTLMPLLRKGKNAKQLMVGDVAALLPRNKQELKLGAVLSINAGIVEELFFRLVLPALLYGVFRDALVAIVISCIVFGLLHYYQGVWGVLGTTLLGVFMMTIYLATGNIFLVMLLHALLDLRSLVLAPSINLHLQKSNRA